MKKWIKWTIGIIVAVAAIGLGVGGDYAFNKAFPGQIVQRTVLTQPQRQTRPNNQKRGQPGRQNSQAPGAKGQFGFWQFFGRGMNMPGMQLGRREFWSTDPGFQENFTPSRQGNLGQGSGGKTLSRRKIISRQLPATVPLHLQTGGCRSRVSWAE